MGAMSAPDQKAADLATAQALAAEVAATNTDVTWRKVTALIDRFGWGPGRASRAALRKPCFARDPATTSNDLAHSPGISSGEVIFNHPNPQYE